MKLDRLPSVDDTSAIINAMKRGDYFVSSGEVLVSSYAVEGTGDQRTISADVEWTFPLDFVEVVWGDGQKTDRQIVSSTDLPAFGKKHFQVPFNAAGKKWVRFAAWDVATNGAFVQPIRLTSERMALKPAWAPAPCARWSVERTHDRTQRSQRTQRNTVFSQRPSRPLRSTAGSVTETRS